MAELTPTEATVRAFVRAGVCRVACSSILISKTPESTNDNPRNRRKSSLISFLEALGMWLSIHTYSVLQPEVRQGKGFLSWFFGGSEFSWIETGVRYGTYDKYIIYHNPWSHDRYVTDGRLSFWYGVVLLQVKVMKHKLIVSSIRCVDADMIW